MNILLLGSTGYLGGNIAKYLSKIGHRIVCVARRNSDLSRLESTNCEIISNEPGQIELTFRQTQIDWVINGVTTYKLNDTLYSDMFESNIMFPLSVLNMAIKYGTKNFMTMGTGLPDDFNIYSFTKAKFSDFGRYLSEKDGINFADLRLEMFYGGEFEPDSKFIKSCILKLCSGDELSLTEGKQKRDIIRVEDILVLVDILIKSTYINECKILPVGSGESHSIREMVEHMAQYCLSDSQIKFGAIESRKGEPDTLADISWYQDIGFKPKYGFYDGLENECQMLLKFMINK